jgi:predicted ATPase/DNA-binding SARP family transcriptional activator
MAAAPDDGGRLRFGLLGPLEIERDGERLAVGGPRQRALLALLLLHANEVVSRERLIDGLWGDDPPETAANALQVAVHGLRRALGATRIETRGSGYLVRVEPGELDLDRFRRLVERARGLDAAAAEPLAEALALWRGEPLADLADASFARVEAERLRELRWAAVEQRIDADLAGGRHADLIAELEWLVADEPLRERLRCQLIVALYRAGRQADALEAYRDARRRLIEELGVEPGPELRGLEGAILRQDAALAAPTRVRAVKGNLPAAVAQLVGRQLEVAAVTGLLRQPDVRLVTLTGPGGTGKTRLALAAAHELGGGLTDGGVFVDLAPLDDPGDVVTAIAHALSVGETRGSSIEGVKEALRERSLVLVLDNFERVVDAAPVVSELLAAAPGLHVLATSRSALRLYGEHEYPVPPLRVPSRDDRLKLESLARNEAVSLFVTRARAVRHDFRLAPDNAAAVAEICVALDGLPLALELAAAQCRQLSPETLAERLGERLDVLTGGPRDRPVRQQTIRATIEWSYELLEASERELFAALGVFAGGFTLAAAAAVCGAAAAEVEALADRSLLQHEEPDGSRRFRMLETVRELALELLEADPAADDVRRRHTQHFAALAEEAGAALWDPVQGPDRALWLDRLELDYGNLRAALAWADREDGATQVRIAAALFDFWYNRSYFEEGRAWLERALAHGGAATPLRAKALHSAGYLALAQGDFAACDALGEQSLELYRALDDREGIGRTVHLLAHSAAWQQQYGRAMALGEESLALARELGHARGIIVSLGQAGALLGQGGDYGRAAALLDEAQDLARRYGDETAQASLYETQSKLALARGEYDAAFTHATECLRIFRAYGTTDGVASGLRLLAVVSEAEGRPERAARLFGAADALRETTGGSLPPSDAVLYDQAAQRAGQSLGDAAFAAARAAGRTLSLEEAVALAGRKSSQANHTGDA